MLTKPLEKIPDSERSTVVKFATPWPPSTNRVWKVGKNDAGRGVVYRSSKYDGFIHNVRAAALAGEIPPIVRAPYYMATVYCFPPDRRVYDADNRLKAVLDALTRVGFWQDDALIVDDHIIKKGVVEGGMLGLIVTALDSWDFQDGVHPSQFRPGATFREYHKPGRVWARIKK